MATLVAENELTDMQDLSIRGVRQQACNAKLLLHIFPTFAIGGVQLRICSIINHFAERYRHIIVTLDGRSESASRISPEIDVTLLPQLRAGRNFPQRILHAIDTISSYEPDLTLTYNWGAIEWALAHRLRPISRHIHLESGFGPEEANSQLRRRAIFRRIALAHVEKVIVPSWTLSSIATDVWKLPSKKIVRISNGVDCQLFGQKPDVDASGGFHKVPGELVAGTVAPLRPEKNLARLLSVFARAAPRDACRLLIIGDGPQRDELRDLASKLNISDRVVFAGHVEQVHKVLGWLDVYAITSDTEQMPNSLLQAMAAGLPVAGVDVGDVKRIVAAENRPFIVAREAEDKLAEAMGKLMGDEKLRQEIGLKNQAHAQSSYSQEKMFQKYSDVLENAA